MRKRRLSHCLLRGSVCNIPISRNSSSSHGGICAQVFPDQAKNPFVANLSRYTAHQNVMVDRVEELRQVHIDGDAIAFTDILAGLVNRMMGRPSRSESET